MINKGSLVYWTLSDEPNSQLYEVIDVNGEVVRIRDTNDSTDEQMAFISHLVLAADEDLWEN